jgi:hypothetical protein
VPRKTRGQDGVACSFPAGDLHPLQHAGLSRRTVSHRHYVHDLGVMYALATIHSELGDMILMCLIHRTIT